MSTNTNFSTIMDAIRANDLEAVKVMYINPDFKICNSWEDPNFCISIAAGNGNIEMIKFLRMTNFAWNAGGEVPTAYNMAAKNGHLEVLKYLQENGCPTDCKNKSIIDYAAAGGNLECVKYLVNAGFLVQKNTCNYAAFHGHLEVLKYLHEQGCTWDKEGIDLTFEGKNKDWKDCLIYMYLMDCKKIYE